MENRKKSEEKKKESRVKHFSSFQIIGVSFLDNIRYILKKKFTNGLSFTKKKKKKKENNNKKKYG
jgi:hypothetical protein